MFNTIDRLFKLTFFTFVPLENLSVPVEKDAAVDTPSFHRGVLYAGAPFQNKWELFVLTRKGDGLIES